MKIKILAVDDSKMMLRIISGTIEMLDFEPLKATNGKEAGAKHYLTKPFNQQDLATHIMKCLGGGV